MNLKEYQVYLEGLAQDLDWEYTETPEGFNGLPYWTSLIRNNRQEGSIPMIRRLARLEISWHKKYQLPWTAPLFTLDTPVEAVLDFWLDKGLDL